MLEESETDCFAWSLIPNHFHLLLRPNRFELKLFMRRLLTGYALNFNYRHKRAGHAFQNRYKPIVCEEETYLMELVRYIHLNPLRARLVADIKELNEYPLCGHSVLMGNKARTAHVYLSHRTKVRILGCHHTSPKVVNNHPDKVLENIKIFRRLSIS